MLTKSFIKERLARNCTTNIKYQESNEKHFLNNFKKNKSNINKLAAVLITLIPNGNDFNVLFTKRSDKLRVHSGQISFPGGVVEEDDFDEVSAALREANEEVGIDPVSVNILGMLDLYLTGTGYKVRPVIGLIKSEPEYKLSSEEVDYVFNVPLSFLIDNKNHQKIKNITHGKKRTFYLVEYNDYYIWGVTAGIILKLSEVLN